MKPKLIMLLLLAGFVGAVSSARAQGYAINWHKVAGGGGTSSGGNYSVSGTIGQADASSAMTGGNYPLTGGFWSLIAVVQTAGAPTLYISHSGATVTVYWQNVANWTLQQNGNLTVPAGWGNSGGVSQANGTNSVTLTNPSGNQYYRLKYTGP